MRFADEVVKADNLENVPAAKAKIEKAELATASQLIDTLVSNSNPNSTRMNIASVFMRR